jgi:hypothetical protein
VFNAFEPSDLQRSDEMGAFLQKWHFGIRKPLFYPLNYGNNDICDFRFAIADCKRPRRAGVDALVVSFRRGSV